MDFENMTDSSLFEALRERFPRATLKRITMNNHPIKDTYKTLESIRKLCMGNIFHLHPHIIPCHYVSSMNEETFMPVVSCHGLQQDQAYYFGDLCRSLVRTLSFSISLWECLSCLMDFAFLSYIKTSGSCLPLIRLLSRRW